MVVIPYVGGLSILGKSCTELVKHMALNGGYPYPYVGGLSIQLTNEVLAKVALS